MDKKNRSQTLLASTEQTFSSLNSWWIQFRRKRTPLAVRFIPIVFGVFAGLAAWLLEFSTRPLEFACYACNFTMGLMASAFFRVKINKYEFHAVNAVAKSKLKQSLYEILHTTDSVEITSLRAQKLLNMFGKTIGVLFFSWVVYYALLIFEIEGVLDHQYVGFKTLIRPAVQCVGLVNSALIFSLYMILTRPKRFLDYSYWKAVHGYYFLAILFVLVVLLFHGPSLEVTSIVNTIGFACLVLFTGRFDSRFICPPALLIGFLYLYAAVQLLPIMLESLKLKGEETTLLKNVMYFMAFGGKVCMYSLITWAYFNHRLFIALLRIVDWLPRLRLDRKKIQYAIVCVESQSGKDYLQGKVDKTWGAILDYSENKKPPFLRINKHYDKL